MTATRRRSRPRPVRRRPVRRTPTGWLSLTAAGLAGCMGAYLMVPAAEAVPAGPARHGTLVSNYDPASFGWSPDADLVPFSYGGVSCGSVSRYAAPLFRAVLGRVVPRLPGGRLHTCSGYAHRNIRGGTTLSFHAYGLAIDVDAESNPFRPGGGYAPHTIPDDAGRLAGPLGVVWGGDWTAPIDYMHFEVHVPRRAAVAACGC
jgi:hypothetical protein